MKRTSENRMSQAGFGQRTERARTMARVSLRPSAAIATTARTGPRSQVAATDPWARRTAVSPARHPRLRRGWAEAVAAGAGTRRPAGPGQGRCRASGRVAAEGGRTADRFPATPLCPGRTEAAEAGCRSPPSPAYGGSAKRVLAAGAWHLSAPARRRGTGPPERGVADRPAAASADVRSVRRGGEDRARARAPVATESACDPHRRRWSGTTLRGSRSSAGERWARRGGE